MQEITVLTQSGSWAIESSKVLRCLIITEWALSNIEMDINAEEHLSDKNVNWLTSIPG